MGSFTNFHFFIIRSINKTHVMVAGGYRGDYTWTNPNLPNDTDGVYVSGWALKKAWMYDGYTWDSLPDMATVRDRPACSLVQLPDGKIRILVSAYLRCI